MLPRRLVEPARDQPPGLAVLGHVVVAEAVELAGEQLRVDHFEHRDPRLRVLGGDEVAERARASRFRGSEEPDRRDVLDAVEHDASR